MLASARIMMKLTLDSERLRQLTGIMMKPTLYLTSTARTLLVTMEPTLCRPTQQEFYYNYIETNIRLTYTTNVY